MKSMIYVQVNGLQKSSFCKSVILLEGAVSNVIYVQVKWSEWYARVVML